MNVLNHFQERNQDYPWEGRGVLEGGTNPIFRPNFLGKKHHEIKILVRGVGRPKIIYVDPPLILTELGYFCVKWAKNNTIKPPPPKILTPLEN